MYSDSSKLVCPQLFLQFFQLFCIQNDYFQLLSQCSCQYTYTVVKIMAIAICTIVTISLLPHSSLLPTFSESQSPVLFSCAIIFEPISHHVQSKQIFVRMTLIPLYI